MSEDFFRSWPLNEIQEKTERYMLNLFNRAPIAFRFGQGEFLYDTEGKRYIDFLCGIAVTSLGHGEADLVEAIRDQAERIIHSSNLFYSQEQAQLAEVLVEHSFPGKVFFTNSGTEATEAAFKLARSYGQQAREGATRIISFEGSFHGRSTAGMCLTAQEKIHSGFGPLLSDCVYLPPNDADLLEKELQDHGGNTCAIFLELIQGESGIRPMNKDFVKAARELCDEHEVLLVFDEIQTGIGRTGKLFCFENYGITPDVMTLAKGLGSGFPIGAMVVAEKFAPYLAKGQHGSTFSGGHLAALIAYETIRIIMTREILSNVNALSDFLFQRLRALAATQPMIREIRGMGLHIGVEFDRACAEIVSRCREAGLLLNCTSGNTVRIMPPLNCSLETAAKGMDIFEAVVRADDQA